jgi:hypothetical protein
MLGLILVAVSFSAVGGDQDLGILREFRLEKAEFLLGEPIVVELSARTDGPGSWREEVGGANRARRRDDNFIFLARSLDGEWADDPQEVPDSTFGGGLAGYETFDKDHPLSRWLAVQRWCRITRPGSYDLFCIHKAQGTPAWTGPIPRDLAERIRRAKIPALKVGDFAHFRVVIKRGSDAERRRMVEQWAAIANLGTERAYAAREAIAFSPVSDFMGLLGRWVAEQNRAFAEASGDVVGVTSAYDWPMLKGIAMNPDRRATALLISVEPWQALWAMRHLVPDRTRDAIPTLIGWLSHQDRDVQRLSHDLLAHWTRQDFGAGREGTSRWRLWWEKNEAGFRPNQLPLEPW